MPLSSRRAPRMISSRLQCGVDPRLQAEFGAGLHPNLLAHEKVDSQNSEFPALTKYLVGAASYLVQPSTFYDIFRACRAVYVIQWLDLALVAHDAAKTENLETRIARLKQETNLEPFDAILFELLTAARFVTAPGVERVVFIKETPPTKTPDLLVVTSGARHLYECKKTARIRDHDMAIRNSVRARLNPFLLNCREANHCVRGEVIFHVSPEKISETSIRRALSDSLKSASPIISADFTVSAIRMEPLSDDRCPYLSPSPALAAERYGYEVRSEWMGLVCQMEARFGHWKWTPPDLLGGQSSWIHHLAWDAGIKWRIDSEEILGRYRRFAFDNVFKALSQVRGAKDGSGVHLWVESDYHLAGRKEVFLDLFNRLKKEQKERFGWIVINETLLDVSPGGYFDLIEHAHLISGPLARIYGPIISNVMVGESKGFQGEEFGVGATLPKIDELGLGPSGGTKVTESGR